MGEAIGTATEAIAHEVLGDARVRELIEAYVRLSGAKLIELGPHLYELAVSAEDRAAFAGRSIVRLAFSVEAVEVDPDAEMAIVGSAFLDQLIEAIRARGARHSAGRIGSDDVEGAALPQLPIPVHRGFAGAPASQLAKHAVGRLTARVVVRAGASLEEHLVDSAVFDLVTGLALGADISLVCDKQLSQPSNTSLPHWDDVPLAPTSKPQRLVTQMLSDLEMKLRPEIQRIRDKSERELGHEVGRIERYYQALLDDTGKRDSDTPEKDARRVFEAERTRRADEERERHKVRATVHPVQLTEWELLVQRVDWPIESHDGRRGEFTGQRVLAGDKAWVLGCPTCGTTAPNALAVCLHNHVACTTCSRDCSICQSAFCTEHGIAACHVDSAPACDAHARMCPSCLRVHCSAHEGECADHTHPACVTCLAACAYCGKVVCDKHAERSSELAPRGARRFCGDCARRCEGGTGEIVGPDEVAACASCEQVVCERHQAKCAVDGQVHCSKHLRRTDRSRRLVCEKDRATCAFERNAVYASDEVRTCATCGKDGCEVHVGSCVEDGEPHCTIHMIAVHDRPGLMACAKHRTVCHVDGEPFSLRGTMACPVCAKRACQAHRVECQNCGRSVCINDLDAQKKRWCATCALLAVTDDPSDDVIAAANQLTGRPGRAKAWKTARDATHTVVEMEFGWTRRIVFVVSHSRQRAESAFVRSALGSRRLL